MRLESIPCPLCAHPLFDIVYQGVDSSFGRLPDSTRSYYPTASKGTLLNRVVRCKACGFVYTNPREHREDILNKYEFYVDPLYVSEEDSRRKNARRIIAHLEKQRRPPGRWLDVGCSAGFLLHEAKRAGWDAFGLEPSRWASEFARVHLNLNVVKGNMEDLGRYPHRHFDVVSMIVVLAHVIEPVRVISEIHRI
ncbi:MAG: class I SAM-dependent methyltransferase [Deltaproteobacteria bacterium]|nr:class I SAM-dependent methyltransferase [Deltaproteobacteria bacterium]